jgi:hypothetical protein
MTTAERRELAHRSEDGVSVTLFWHADSDRLVVCVSDARDGGYFEIHSNPERALDVYYNPYDYVPG